MVHLRPAVPYTRSEVEYYLDRILGSLGEGRENLSERQRYLLDRLKQEFMGKASRPGDREDVPLWYIKEGRRFATLDLSAGIEFVKKEDKERGEVRGISRPGILVDLGNNITLQTEYYLQMGPERGSNIGTMKPGPRVTSFRGLTSEYQLGYLSYRGNRWGLKAGRDYIHWGNNLREGLLFSRTAGSIDQIAFDLSISRFRLTGVHGVLDAEIPRRLAAHRLSIELPHHIYIGVGESVIYTGRSFDYTYLLPTSSFYANQYNEEGDDNILWGFDFKIPVRRRFLLYGEVLIDDFQYENDPPAPDKVGFNLTSETLFQVGRMDVEISMGYTYLDIFTYAHKDSTLNCYVMGEGDPGRNALIGSSLGPDADRWNLKILTGVHPRVDITLGGNFTRRGEGNSLRDWDRKEDPDPPFPSGRVREEKGIMVGGEIDLGGGSMIAAAGGLNYISDSVDQTEEREEFAYLRVILDF